MASAEPGLGLLLHLLSGVRAWAGVGLWKGQFQRYGQEGPPAYPTSQGERAWQDGLREGQVLLLVELTPSWVVWFCQGLQFSELYLTGVQDGVGFAQVPHNVTNSRPQVPSQEPA